MSGVRQYIASLEWDGTPRVAELLRRHPPVQQLGVASGNSALHQLFGDEVFAAHQPAGLQLGGQSIAQTLGSDDARQRTTKDLPRLALAVKHFRQCVSQLRHFFFGAHRDASSAKASERTSHQEPRA